MLTKSESCALGELDRKEQIWSDFSKDMVMADARYIVTQISNSLFVLQTPHWHRVTHLPVFSDPFVRVVQKLFETSHVRRTRLLCLSEFYFPDKGSQFGAHKDKGRDIITYMVWWHPSARANHLKTEHCLFPSKSRSSANSSKLPYTKDRTNATKSKSVFSKWLNHHALFISHIVIFPSVWINNRWNMYYNASIIEFSMVLEPTGQQGLSFSAFVW